jgi:hypothetical protein
MGSDALAETAYRVLGTTVAEPNSPRPQDMDLPH